MNLREMLSLHKLPLLYRKRVLAYSLRKMLGRDRTERQTEANRLLRFLARAAARVTGASHNGIQIDVKIFGKIMRVEARHYPSSDLGIVYQVLGKFEYAPVVALVEKLQLSGPLRIIDAGANVGYASLYFHAAFPQAMLAALEIDPNNARQLEQHVDQNGMKNVRVWQQALWKRNANLEIKRDFRDQSECSFYVEETPGTGDVIGRSLQEICSQMHWTSVDILKIDIEGGERYLFETEELADDLLRATRILAIEIHDEFQIRPAILRHLRRHNFTHFEHGDLTIAYRP